MAVQFVNPFLSQTQTVNRIPAVLRLRSRESRLLTLIQDLKKKGLLTEELERALLDLSQEGQNAWLRDFLFQKVYEFIDLRSDIEEQIKSIIGDEAFQTGHRNYRIQLVLNRFQTQIQDSPALQNNFNIWRRNFDHLVDFQDQQDMLSFFILEISRAFFREDNSDERELIALIGDGYFSRYVELNAQEEVIEQALEEDFLELVQEIEAFEQATEDQLIEVEVAERERMQHMLQDLLTQINQAGMQFNSQKASLISKIKVFLKTLDRIEEGMESLMTHNDAVKTDLKQLLNRISSLLKKAK